jgi:hypothetical protein
MATDSSTNSTKDKTRSLSALTIILLVISIPLLVMLLRTAAIFLALALLPSIVAYYVDRTATRYIFHTVFACNLAATLPALGRIIKNGISATEVQVVMGDAVNWLIIYGAAGFGWLLVYAAPVFSKGLINVMHQRKIRRLERTQKRIISEWGTEVERFHAEKLNPQQLLPAPASPLADDVL